MTTMTVYVPTLVFSESARDEAVARLVNDGKHCIVFRDSVQRIFGIVGCSQDELFCIKKKSARDQRRSPRS